ncbi:unnamed protein product [marine sediment metagenome]|uniref:Uncharacterized protein n=1 Tax=marine sediment metagenome TaxID=412755 RepID=X1NHD4_9ZZZZ
MYTNFEGEFIPQGDNHIKSVSLGLYKNSNISVPLSIKPSITDNARKVAEEIIKEHKPKSLTKDKQEKLKNIIESYESKLKK